jgi:hypothetical protein
VTTWLDLKYPQNNWLTCNVQRQLFFHYLASNDFKIDKTDVAQRMGEGM